MRVLVAFGSLLLGGLTGVAAVAVHSLWWGLLLGLVTTAAIVWAQPPGRWTRLPFAVGWSGVVWLAMTPRSEGDYVIAADASGYTVLVAAFVIVVAALAVPGRPSRPPEASRGVGRARAGSEDGSSPT